MGKHRGPLLNEDTRTNKMKSQGPEGGLATSRLGACYSRLLTVTGIFKVIMLMEESSGNLAYIWQSQAVCTINLNYFESFPLTSKCFHSCLNYPFDLASPPL